MSLMSDRAAKRNMGFPAPEPSKNAASVLPVPPVVKTPPTPLVDPVAAFAVTAEEFSVKDAPIEALDVVVPPPPEAPAPKVALAPSHRVRVLADGKVLLGACMHRFRAGNILDAGQYDSRVFGQLLKALKTEPVEN